MKLKGNYFGSDYMQADIKGGVLKNRSGTRLIALNEDFLLGFRRALMEETGQAHHAVFETCGQTWGENMAQRFEKELAQYYEAQFHEMPMSMFSLLFKDFWSRHGWGELTINWEEGFAKGIFEVKIFNPAFSSIFAKDDAADETDGSGGRFHDDVFTGVLKAFFSRFAQRELHCHQTAAGEEEGLLVSWFVVGIPERLKKVPDMVLSQKSHAEILAHAQAVQV